MVEVIPKQIKDVWDSWNIRGMIILSLSLQTILIFFSPLRKRKSNKFLVLLLWSSYLLADLSANFAVALIAKNQDDDYDHSLLIWHIATELCYQEESSTKENCDQDEYHRNRVISKMLSDYMMYLLIMQPQLMSEVAGIGKIRFRDTLAEAERLFKKMGIRNSRNVKLASEKILSVDTSIEPRDVKGNHSKSVLFEASSLAKELQKLYGEDKWKTLSKVWLEFLFHAASHCDGTARMELLSKGGELINFVWLLMAHFGLGD